MEFDDDNSIGIPHPLAPPLLLLELRSGNNFIEFRGLRRYLAIIHSCDATPAPFYYRGRNRSKKKRKKRMRRMRRRKREPEGKVCQTVAVADAEAAVVVDAVSNLT